MNGADRAGNVADSVTVVAFDGATPTAQARAGCSIRVGWLVVLLVVGLVVLLLLPMEDPLSRTPLSEGELPPPADDRLVSWPARGPWAADERFVDEAASAWREAARSDRSIDAPGGEIVPLWAGPVGGAQMAVLQSVGLDGVVRLAHVSDMLYGWLQPRLRVLSTTPVDLEPNFVVFPFVGPDDRGGQLDPDVLSTFQMLPGPTVRNGDNRVLRLEGARFVPVEMRKDGLSEPWAYGRWWIRDEPVIAVLARSEDDALVSVVRLDPDEMLPTQPPVELVEPGWGTDGPYGPDDYLAASAALESIGESTGRAAVLGSAVTAAGRATLVQVEPQGSRRPRTMATLSGQGDVVVSSPAPVAPGAQAAIGAVRTLGGDLVVVAAAPPQTTLITIKADGEVIATGVRMQGVVVERDTDVRVLSAQAFRGDDPLPALASLVVADIAEH